MTLLWIYLKNYKKLLALTLVLATINQVFSLLDPLIFRRIIDNYATRVGEISHDQFLHGIILLLLATVGVAFVSRVAKNFQDYYLNVIVQKLGARMYNHSVSHSFSLPFAVFEDQRSGEFLDKLRKARDDAQKLLQTSINILFFSLVGVVFVLVYAFIVHWLVGLAFFVMIPVLGLVTFWISRKVKTAQEAIIKETAALAGATTETLRNVELVKSLGLETQEVNRLNNVNQKILDLELKKVKYVRTFSFIHGTLINLLRSVLLLLMLWLIFTGGITLGAFFSLLFYSFFIFNPLSELGNVATSYQEAKASLARLDQILQTPKEKVPDSPIDTPTVDSLGFKDVSFTYQSGSTPALQNVNFQVTKGKTIAFAGPSGSGKTTIIKLLVGLYSPTAGAVEINSHDLKSLSTQSYRSRIGFVSQDTQLFAGTIRENLLFVRPGATDDECLQALQSASAMSIIERGTMSQLRGGARDNEAISHTSEIATSPRQAPAPRNDGLDTVIGEGGLKLSGGEKQRLSIARALLRNPDLIIFDEATSSLDSLTEQEITDTIKKIKQERPSLITVLVAHRLSTILHADTIYVLEKGRIEEHGSHQELLEKKGLYSALWRQQIAARE